MKPGQDCSCTSCSKWSMSDRKSIMSLAGGSRIDKLYLNKYIPMREQNLVKKLVRTRAVYDDIRNKLLSDTSNISANKHQKGSAMSECCSCCSCDSVKQGHRKLNASSQIQEKDISRQKKRGDRTGKRVQYKAKHIRSDPCSCVLEAGLVKLPAKNLKKKSNKTHRSLVFSLGEKEKSGMGEAYKTAVTRQNQTKRKIKAGAKRSSEGSMNKGTGTKGLKKHIKKSRPKYAKAVENAIENIDDIKYRKTLEKWACEYGCDSDKCDPRERFKQVLQDIRQHSGEFVKEKLEKVSITSDKGARQKKEGLKGEGLKGEGLKGDGLKGDSLKGRGLKEEGLKGGEGQKEEGEEEELENVVQNIHDDEYKKLLEMWACDFDCNPDECDPLQCYKIRKAQLEAIESEKGTKIKHKDFGTGTKSQKIRNKQAQEGERRDKTVDIKVKSKNKVIGDMKHTEPQAEVKSKPETHIPTKSSQTGVSKTKRRHKITGTAEKISKKSGGFDLKRCDCTLKLKPTSAKTKMPKEQRHKSSSRSIRKTSRATKFETLPSPGLLPNECEPMTCIPGECDPMECEKRIKLRSSKKPQSAHTSTQRPTHRSKSTPNLRRKAASTGAAKMARSHEELQPGNQNRKKLQKETLPKQQGVRISSSFSFDVEFHKGDDPNRKPHTVDSSSGPRKAMKVKSKGTGDKRQRKNKAVSQARARAAHKNSQSSSSEKSEGTMTQHSLRRCFCTLKFAKRGKKVKSSNTQVTKKRKFSRGTSTSGINIPTTGEKHAVQITDKGTENRNNSKYAIMLLPYECEPGICMPGECQPQKCQELINARNQKGGKNAGTDHRLKPVHSNTDRALMTSNTNKKDNRRQHLRHTMPLKERGSQRELDKETLKSIVAPVIKKGLINSTIKCLCKLKTKMKKHNQGTTTAKETKIKGNKTNNLKPYECEPDFCIPGECDPYECLERINIRDNVTKETKITSDLTKLKPYECEPDFCTPGECDPYECLERINIRDNVTKETKVKSNKTKLKPYECEPDFCIPGDCDPYECFERIKIRENIQPKDVGVVTGKKKYSSNSTSSSASKTSSTQVRSKIKTEQHKKENQKRPASPPANDNSRARPETVQEISSRRGVRISSTMGFSIEVSKNVYYTQNYYGREFQQKHSIPHQTSDDKVSVQNREYPSKKTVKPTVIRPMLKRCLCTLNFKNRYIESGDTNIRNIQATVLPLQIFYDNVNILKTKAKELFDKRNNFPSLHFSDTRIRRSGCSPSECQKRIMKSLIKNATSMISVRNIKKSASGGFSRLQHNSMLHTRQIREDTNKLKPKITHGHTGLKLDYQASWKNRKQTDHITSLSNHNVKINKNIVTSRKHNIHSIEVILKKIIANKQNLNKKSNTSLRMNGKKGVYDLKRCLCALKLRSKTTNRALRLVQIAFETKKNNSRMKLIANGGEYECQFSVNELKEGYSGDFSDYNTIQNKLKEHFQNDIECHLIKRDMIILYKNGTASKKLCKDWYEKRLNSKEDERTRIVQMAAGLKCTNLCSNCNSSEKCSNMEEKPYEEVNDSEEILDEEPMQTGNNIEDEKGDGCEDFDDLLETETFVESNDEEMPSKKQKLMDK